MVRWTPVRYSVYPSQTGLPPWASGFLDLGGRWGFETTPRRLCLVAGTGAYVLYLETSVWVYDLEAEM